MAERGDTYSNFNQSAAAQLDSPSIMYGAASSLLTPRYFSGDRVCLASDVVYKSAPRVTPNMADTQNQGPQSLGNKSQDRAIAAGKLVETVNALSAPDFFAKYAPGELLTEAGTCQPEVKVSRLQADAANMPSRWLEACLKLIEETSAQDYRTSEIKWSTSKKRKEMKAPDMKYIILFHGTFHLAGFISFMITYEDGYEVLYIYEVHFAPEWQGKGLGKKLINIVEVIGQNVGITKIMLTVFRANRRAVGWYAQLGYEEDEFSPGPRKLRNGAIKEPSYIILSKQVKR